MNYKTYGLKILALLTAAIGGQIQLIANKNEHILLGLLISWVMYGIAWGLAEHAYGNKQK